MELGKLISTRMKYRDTIIINKQKNHQNMYIVKDIPQMCRLITVSSSSSSPTQISLTDKSLSSQPRTKSHIDARMFSKFQKASDKLRSLVQTRANGSSFGSTMSTTSKKSSPVIQDLYELCKSTFLPPVSPSSPPPLSSSSVRAICSLLDTIGPMDVGLKEDNPDVDNGHGFGPISLNKNARWPQPITFLDIFESECFTMCVFCFPGSSVIPLHDHPGMTVFSKILYGSLQVKAYDWVDPETKGQRSFSGRLAKLVKNEVVTAPCNTSVLYPKSGGNLHCFTAITPCAVLDILAPPYREDIGRGCTYFTDHPYSSYASKSDARIKVGKEEDYAWLVKVETPENLYMRQGRYVGPTIQV